MGVAGQQLWQHGVQSPQQMANASVVQSLAIGKCQFVVDNYIRILGILYFLISRTCCCLVAQSCPAICDPTDCSMPGFPQFSSVQSLSRVRLFATPWIAARQASLSITSSQSLRKLMSIESVMPSNHLILCRPLHLRPSTSLSIRVFSHESVLRIRWPR